MEPCLYILMVDDDDSDLTLFDLAIEKTHFDIRLDSLTAGQQAIDCLEAKGVYADRSLHPWPDVVVVDLEMPGLSGFEFLSWRKASPGFSSIPVVVLSGSKDPVHAKRAAELGANKYIVKPSEFEDWKKV